MQALSETGRNDHLNNLRRWRVPQRSPTIEESLLKVLKDAKQSHRTVGALRSGWSDLLPAWLAEHTTVVSTHRGVLLVRVPNSGIKFRFDRWLRSGGKEAIIRKSPSTIRTILIEVVAAEETAESHWAPVLSDDFYRYDESEV